MLFLFIHLSMNEYVTLLNISRFLVGILILGFASYTDIKTRKAPNVLWITMGSLGACFLIVQYFLMDLSSQIIYLLFIPIMIAIMYVLFQIKLIFGGADAKALMALAILVPLIPSMFQFPLSPTIMPFSWVIFSNSVVLFLILPFSLLLYNLIQGNIVFPYCFIGYKISANKARNHFVWPLEKIENHQRKFLYKPSKINEDDIYETFIKEGINDIWVTPKVPFMIPLTAGFITAFFLGDILFIIMHSVLHA